MNIFLSREPRDVDTALLLEKAIVCDYGNGIAGTDGEQVFINTEDKLNELLPAYNEDMLKWLLWHEEYHKLLRHHNRYFKYCDELLNSDNTEEALKLTKQEVNIIMDILVHDTLSKLFPELVDTAIKNCAQMRNRNSLKYTFKTYTLEEMLEEYRKSKEDEQGTSATGTKGQPTDEDTEDDEPKGTEGKSTEDTEGKSTEDTESQSDEGTEGKSNNKDTSEDTDTEDKGEHEKTDWSELEKIDQDKEFLTRLEVSIIKSAVNKLKHEKINMAKLTTTLSGLVCNKKERTYAVPSRINVSPNVILKGRKPTKTSLYICFDATGSMSSEIQLFKEVIHDAVPQAMNVPCDWFCNEYYHHTFKEMYEEGEAFGGYSDDGDRTIKLCYEAEQKGYSVIGATDGGGGIRHLATEDLVKQLKRTIIVTYSNSFRCEIQRLNPRLQIICLGD